MSVWSFYKDGNNPWATVTQVQGTEKKSYRDAYGRTVQIIEKIGSSSANTWYGYDRLGNLEYLWDNALNFTYMAYDSMGRKIEMADPDTGYWLYEYDDSGRLTHQFDQLGNAIAFEYFDHLGRITAKYFQSWDANLNEWVTVDGVSYWYDEQWEDCCPVYPGQLAMVFDRSGWEYYGYDVRGRSLATMRQFDDGPAVYLTQTSYDDADRLYEITYPNNYAKIRYTYNNAGHVATVSTIYGSGTPTTLYQVQPADFDDLGRPTRISWGNSVQTLRQYYPLSKRLNRVQSYRFFGQYFQDLTYTFDTVGNLKSLSDLAFLTGNPSASLGNIQYDDLFRLTSYTREGVTTSFDYNAIGNVLLNGESGAGTYVYAGIQPHAVTSANGKDYTYDDAGNMITRPTQSLYYDQEQQLKYVNSYTNSISFDYDYSGARLRKRVPMPGGTFEHIWMGKFYEVQGNRVLLHAWADGQRIATFSPGGAEFYYYHPDHLGSTTVMTDKFGNLTKHYEYKAFGSERFTLSFYPVISQRYTGQVLDHETGLYYYNSRYYDAELGRFIQPDSIVPEPKDPQTLNRYTYVLNNPLKLVDPSGHQGELNSYSAPAPFSVMQPVIPMSEIKTPWPKWLTDDGPSFRNDFSGTWERIDQFEAAQKIYNGLDYIPLIPTLKAGAEYVLQQDLLTGEPKEVSGKNTIDRSGVDIMTILMGRGVSTARPQVTRLPILSDESVFLQSSRRALFFDGEKWRATAMDGLVTPHGSYNYVVMGGRLIIGRGPGGHSALSYGMDVDFAGRIRFGHGNNAGVLRRWDNDSGHFKPSADLSNQAPLPPDLFHKVSE
jgi:RHS repeat-associated protein